MTEEEEDKYVFAQDLTRLRIAVDVLHEVIHDDFMVGGIISDLNQQIDAAFKKMQTQSDNG